MREDGKRPSADAPPSSLGSLLLGWVQQGVDSFMSTQRLLVDFAARKNANALKSLREGLSDPEHSPVAILTEMAVEATANFTEAQRILLNLAQQENEIVMTGVKERVGASGMATMVADRVQHGFDIFIEMQQNFLTTASKHAQQRLHATKAGKGMDINCLVDAARDALDNFVHAQKKFLDVVMEGGGKAKGKPEEGAKKQTPVTQLAREAADAFIDAQKKLLDLAGQQMNVELQMANKVAELAKEIGPLPMPKFTGDGVKRFVDAEKAIIDSVMKPVGETKVNGKAEHAPKRPVRRGVGKGKVVQAGA